MGLFKDTDRLTSNGLESFAQKLWTKIKNNFKTKQETKSFSGSTTKTPTSITQDVNGEISVTYSDIDFSTEVPNLDVSTTEVEGGTKVTIVTKKGTTQIDSDEFTVLNGQDGVIGHDGKSAKVELTKTEITGGVELKFDSYSGEEKVDTETINVMNGVKGEDGVSPTVSLTPKSSGSQTLTITDATHTENVVINDGINGEQGDPGLPALVCTQVNETSNYNGGYIFISKYNFNRTPVEGDVFFIQYASSDVKRYGIQRCVVDSYNEEDETWKVYTYESHDFPLIQGPQGEQGESGNDGIGVTVSEISNGIKFEGESGEASITAIGGEEQGRGDGVLLTVGSTELSIEGGKDGDDGNTIIKYSDTVFMYDESQPVFNNLKADNSKIGDLVVWSDDDGTYISQIARYGTYGSSSSQIAYGDAKNLISGADGKSIHNIGEQGIVNFDDSDTKTSGSIASAIFANINVGETIVFNYQNNEYIATVISITENVRYGFTALFNNCACISGNLGTYVPFEYNPSEISSDSPASDCKTYWENMENGVKIVYNNRGTEYTLIFSKQGEYGTILRYTYNSFYFEILQKTNNGWKQENWGKMDADVANKVNHTLSLGGKTFNGAADVSVSFRDIMPTNANYDYAITNQCIHMFTTRSIISDRKDKFGTFMYTFRNSNNTPRYGIVNLYWDTSASQMRLSDYVYGNSDSSSGAIFFIRKNSDDTYNIYCKTTDRHAYLSYALVTCAWAADIHNSETTDTENLVPETIVNGTWNGYKLVVGQIPPTSEMEENTIYIG